ncbi:MAG: hypothetical protein Q8K31_05130 [Burkholderiaceae bacterium]|nr:hypothetical protein [Burkholderiaceae bacterium]
MKAKADSHPGAGHGAGQRSGVIRMRYQSNTAFDDLPGYAAALRAHATDIFGKEVEVEFNGLPAEIYGGSMPGEVLDDPYLKHMVQDAALEAALCAPDKVLAAFAEAGRRAIAEGADLLIPAEGILNEVVYSNRLQRIGNAAVMDCVGVVLLHAQMMVRARRVLGLGVGREWSYPRASRELVTKLRRGTGRDTA